MLDYYELLGVPADAPQEEIRAAYRLLVARAHPDVNAAPDAERQTALLNEAWSVLRDAKTRTTYDAAGLATAAPLRCQRCSMATPNLRFVVFARARGAELPRHDGALVCVACRRLEAREAAFSSALRGRYVKRRARRLTLAAIARDLRGGKIDVQTSAALLRQIGFAYARESRSREALSALEAVLEFGPDPAVSRIVARLREALGAVPVRTAPVRDVPVRDVPVQEVTAQEIPVQEVPVQEIPVRDVPVREVPAREVPARDARVRRVRPPRRLQVPRFAPIAATAAVLLLVALGFGWFGLSHRHSPSASFARNPQDVAANVDPALRDDVERLASLVRDRPVPAGGTPYLFDLTDDKTFALAYAAAVATLPIADRERNPWLVTLETTSQPSDVVEMPQAADYVLARGCAPEKCNDGFVGIAYNSVTHAVAGAAYYGDGWHEFGSDAPGDRAMAVLSVAKNGLRVPRRFGLDPERSLELGRFVAAVGT